MTADRASNDVFYWLTGSTFQLNFNGDEVVVSLYLVLCSKDCQGWIANCIILFHVRYCVVQLQCIYMKICSHRHLCCVVRTTSCELS